MKPKFYRPNKNELRGYFKSKPLTPGDTDDIVSVFITTNDIFELIKIEDTLRPNEHIVYCKEKNVWNGHVPSRMKELYIPVYIDYNKFWTKFNEN